MDTLYIILKEKKSKSLHAGSVLLFLGNFSLLVNVWTPNTFIPSATLVQKHFLSELSRPPFIR